MEHAEKLASMPSQMLKARHSNKGGSDDPLSRVRKQSALTQSEPIFFSGKSIEYEMRAIKAEKEYRGPTASVLVFFACVYLFSTITGVVYIVKYKMVSIDVVMLIPILLALLMCVWLAILSWPLRYRYNTISAACASPRNFLRIILVILTCLLSTALAAVLVDEYASRNHEARYDTYIICEVIFSLLLPLTGIFPTVEIPNTNVLKFQNWGNVNLGTQDHPVNVNGFVSFLFHFLGVIPFMFCLPFINLWYAHMSRHQTWVLLLAYAAVASLLLFVVAQVCVHLQKAGKLEWLSSDNLYMISYTLELCLVISVSLGTLLFSMKRNLQFSQTFDLDAKLAAAKASVLKGMHLFHTQ